MAELFTTAAIPFEVEHERQLLDSVYIGDQLDPMYALKLPSDRFDDANEIVRQHAQTQVNTLSPDYYLFEFSDRELMEVVRNKDQWNAFDQGVAARLLQERHVTIVDDLVEAVENAYRPLHIDNATLVIEYAVSAFLPYAGIVIGLATLAAYKTLHDGKRVKMYDENSRMHAKAMIAVGIVRLLITFRNQLFYTVL